LRKGFVTKEVKAVLSSSENNKGRAGSLLKVNGGCEVLRVVGEEKEGIEGEVKVVLGGVEI
jgi:hypothetical protein